MMDDARDDVLESMTVHGSADADEDGDGDEDVYVSACHKRSDVEEDDDAE